MPTIRTFSKAFAKARLRHCMLSERVKPFLKLVTEILQSFSWFHEIVALWYHTRNYILYTIIIVGNSLHHRVIILEVGYPSREIIPKWKKMCLNLYLFTSLCSLLFGFSAGYKNRIRFKILFIKNKSMSMLQSCSIISANIRYFY